MALAKLKIENHGGHGRHTKVWLNDIEISEFLTEVTVHYDLHSVVQAKLCLALGDLEVDGVTMAVLQAHVNHKDVVLDDEVERALIRLQRRERGLEQF